MLAMETSVPSSSNHTTLAKMEIASPSTIKLQYVTERIIGIEFEILILILTLLKNN